MQKARDSGLSLLGLQTEARLRTRPEKEGAQMEWHITIPGDPATKKNSSEIYVNKGKRFIMPSQRFRDYQELALWFIPKLQIDFPVNIKCEYFRRTKARVDLVNLLEATDDILQVAGAITNDDWRVVAGHDGSRVFFDKENPRTEITITTMEER